MSKSRIEITIPCEWWVLRAAFLAIVDFMKPEDVRIDSHFVTNGCVLSGAIPWEDPATNATGATGIGEMSLIMGSSKDKTKLTVEYISDAHAAFWREVAERLERFMLTVHDGRLSLAAIPRTPDEAIEYYYRARSHGAKLTLKDIALGSGLRVEAVRKHKQRYDKAGKWGSKKRQNVS